MRYIDLADGSVMKQNSPLKEVPFYTAWLEALLLRRAAFETSGKGVDPESGLPRRIIMPYGREHEQACKIMLDGTVRVICLGCGGPVEPMMTGYSQKLGAVTVKRGIVKPQSRLSSYDAQRSFNQVRIGGLVQFKDDAVADEAYGNRRISLVRKWRVRSVSRMGMGCQACVERYNAESSRIAVENSSKQALFEAMIAAYSKLGQIDKMSKLTQPRLYTAFLDVFDRSAPLTQFSEAQEARL